MAGVKNSALEVYQRKPWMLKVHAGAQAWLDARTERNRNCATHVCSACRVEKPRDEFGRANNPKGIRRNCKPCHAESNARWRAKNPEASKTATANWQKNNPDKRKEKRKRFLEANPGYDTLRQRQYIARKRAAEGKPPVVKLTQAQKDLRKKERRSTAMFKINTSVSNGIRKSLRNLKARRPSFSLLPYTPQELYEHIERQFHDGMTWDHLRRGEIEIDHIRPLSMFTFTSHDCEDFKMAWALCNLRPLWAQDNRKKHAKRLFLI